MVEELSHMSFNRLSSLVSLFCKVFLDLEGKLNLCTCCIIFEVDSQLETIEALSTCGELNERKRPETRDHCLLE